MSDGQGAPAARVMDRIAALAALSDCPDTLTRLPLGPAQAQAARLIAQWMREAGMDVTRDGAGNLVARYPAPGADNRPVLALGSHFDTVRDAGRFDGTLGIVLAIEVVADLHARGIVPDAALQILAFDDEEGVCFGSSRLGSHAFSGALAPDQLADTDADGVSVAERLRAAGLSPEAALSPELAPLDAYVELHIEQGPVLDHQGAALGVVTAIAGQSRSRVTLGGVAGHAGTVPMDLRHDALAGAAEMILAIEALARRLGIVATVGQIACAPGAGNVIASEVVFSIDLRAGEDGVLAQARETLAQELHMIAARRGLDFLHQPLSDVAPTPCDPRLQAQLAAAIGGNVTHLASGAGHDAIAMARLAPVAMLFVACKGGISHHPDEDVAPADIAAAFAALREFVLAYRPLGQAL